MCVQIIGIFLNFIGMACSLYVAVPLCSQLSALMKLPHFDHNCEFSATFVLFVLCRTKLMHCDITQLSL